MKPLNRVHERILAYMRNRDWRPTYAGSIAIEVGYGLARTQEFLDHLEERGDIYRLNDVDLKKLHIDERCIVYCLVVKTV